MTSVLVLNVDDYDAGRYAKTRLLLNAGFQVQEATNGEDALAMLENTHPDLVLLDVRLPDIDGRDISRRIRANPAMKAIRIIQTSAAFITAEDMATGYESGADGYITAPYLPGDLLAMVRSLTH